jgi:hypothetical protein
MVKCLAVRMTDMGPDLVERGIGNKKVRTL